MKINEVRMKSPIIVLVSIQLVALTLLCYGDGYANALSLWPSYLTGVKSYLVGLTKGGLISRLTMVNSFNETLANIRERYEAARQNGELEGRDESEISAIYYKIVIEEVRNLRARIESDKSGNLAREVVGLNADELENQAREDLNACEHDSDCNLFEQVTLEDPDLEDYEEAELLNQLEDLKNWDDYDEMGWAFNNETRTALKAQTKKVLAELVAHELKQLGTAVISGFLLEGPIGPFAAVLGGSIKFKLVQYLTNCLVDLLSTIMGKRIEITPHYEIDIKNITDIQLANSSETETTTMLPMEIKEQDSNNYGDDDVKTLDTNVADQIDKKESSQAGDSGNRIEPMQI